MSSPPKSSAMRTLSARNSRTMKDLNKELIKLETERKNKMKELNLATKHFLDLKLRPLSARSREMSPDRCSFASLPAYSRTRSMSRSPSPSPRSPLNDSFSSSDSSKNNKVVYRHSISTDENTTISGRLSQNGSPETQQRNLLSKRSKDDHNQIKKSRSISETNITQVTYLALPGEGIAQATSFSNPTSPRHHTKKTSSNVGIPKIIVSDTGVKLPEIMPTTATKQSVSSVKNNSPEKKDVKGATNDNCPVKIETNSSSKNSSRVIIHSTVEHVNPDKKDTQHSAKNNVQAKKDLKSSSRSNSPVKKDSMNSSRSNSPERKNLKDSPRKGNIKSPLDDAMNVTLQIPTRRSRSSSVPSISSSMQHLISMAKTTPTSMVDDCSLVGENPIELRPRSNSICVPYFVHLKNAPRRDSLLRKYIARPKIFRRTAKTIDQLISDLAKGISHEDILDYKSRSKPITAEEWENLKKCRYLRMPSKNEDVKGNTLDINAIFSE